jgi:hypothetical protein
MLSRNELLVLLKDFLLQKLTYICQYMSMERSDHSFYSFTILSGLSAKHTVKINFVTEMYITLPIFLESSCQKASKV